MHMLEAGINLFVIRDFLGHNDVTTTEIYARVSQKKKEEALAKLNPGIIQKAKKTTPRKKYRWLLDYLRDQQMKY